MRCPRHVSYSATGCTQHTDIIQDYDPESDVIIQQQGDQSPKDLELKQFDAYLKRELPRKIRKELEAAMESIMGPMEETLKSQLEDIVRNCHENLTRSYRNATLPTDAMPEEIAGPSGVAERQEPSSLPNLATPELEMHPTAFEAGALYQYHVPPESSPELWPDMTQPDEFFLTATWSDSAYYSQFEGSGYPMLSETWPLRTTTEPFSEENGKVAYTDIATTDSEVAHLHEEVPSTEYAGKGKDKAVHFLCCIEDVSTRADE